jgi:hypothetical protein
LRGVYRIGGRPPLFHADQALKRQFTDDRYREALAARGASLTRWQRYALAASAAGWLGAVSFGAHAVWTYQTTPGTPGAPPQRWPRGTSLPRRADRFTLLVLVHPQCPCTRATVAELSSLMDRLGDRVAAHVLVYRPREFPAGWERTDVWTAAERIRGVTVTADLDGEEALRFGGATSGQVLLYGPDGLLRFSGGITNARGHRGQGAGQQRIETVVNGGVVDTPTSRVFGCALAQPAG